MQNTHAKTHPNTKMSNKMIEISQGEYDQKEININLSNKFHEHSKLFLDELKEKSTTANFLITQFDAMKLEKETMVHELREAIMKQEKMKEELSEAGFEKDKMKQELSEASFEKDKMKQELREAIMEKEKMKQESREASIEKDKMKRELREANEKLRGANEMSEEIEMEKESLLSRLRRRLEEVEELTKNRKKEADSYQRFARSLEELRLDVAQAYTGTAAKKNSLKTPIDGKSLLDLKFSRFAVREIHKMIFQHQMQGCEEEDEEDIPLCKRSRFT